MLIRIGYDIALRLPFPTAVIYVLHVHPARKGDLVGSEDFRASALTGHTSTASFRWFCLWEGYGYNLESKSSSIWGIG
jgi:hypothetical protein